MCAPLLKEHIQAKKVGMLGVSVVSAPALIARRKDLA